MPSRSPNQLKRALLLGLALAGLALIAVLIVLWLGGGGDELPYKYGGFD